MISDYFNLVRYHILSFLNYCNNFTLLYLLSAVCINTNKKIKSLFWCRLISMPVKNTCNLSEFSMSLMLKMFSNLKTAFTESCQLWKFRKHWNAYSVFQAKIWPTASKLEMITRDKHFPMTLSTGMEDLRFDYQMFMIFKITVTDDKNRF